MRRSRKAVDTALFSNSEGATQSCRSHDGVGNNDMHRKHATLFIYRDMVDGRPETCCSSHVENIWTSFLQRRHLSYTSSSSPLQKLIVRALRLPHFSIDLVYLRKSVGLKDIILREYSRRPQLCAAVTYHRTHTLSLLLDLPLANRYLLGFPI